MSAVATARRSRRGDWLLAPNWLWTVVFFVVPLALVVVFSLGRRGTDGGILFGVDGGSYARLADPLYLEVYLRSFAMAAVATLATVAIGYPLAYFLAFRAGARRHLLLLALIVPFWTSLLIRAYAWIIILNDNGLLPGVLGALSLPEPHVLYRSPAIALGLVYSYLPLMVLPLFVALDRIDPALLEAARDLGANRRRAFLRVTLRLSLPGLVAGVLLVAVPATGEVLVPALLGGGRELMIGNLIGNAFITDQDWPFGGALSVVLIAVLLLAVLAFLRLPAVRESQGGQA